MPEILILIPVFALHVAEALYEAENGNRKVKALTKSGRYYVEWININNHTCFIRHNKNSGCMVNCEDVIFFIQVPANAKTIY